jgi:sec-independent protein translocase protein TatC
VSAANPETKPTPESAASGGEARMTFTAHLGELRMRMIRSCIAASVGLIVCYAFSNTIIEFLSQPLRGLSDEPVQVTEPVAGQGVREFGGVTWTVLSPMEPFVVKLKIAAYGGLFIAFPVILYQLCAFVFPGLTSTERRAVKFMLFGCTILAVGGSSMAYWLIFPQVLPFLVKLAPGFVNVQLRLNETLSIILKGIAGFGVAFQMPMVIIVLVYLGILTPATLKAYRKVSIVAIFVVAAIMTPPDPISQLMMALPLLVLYEISLWASYAIVRRREKAAAAAEV